MSEYHSHNYSINLLTQILLSFCHCYRPDPYYSYISVDVEDTDSPIDVDQNVAYFKHIESKDNVCYSTSSRNEQNEIENQSE